MSVLLESLLTAEQRAACEVNERFLDRLFTPPQATDYRVNVDWEGGGFGITLPFPSYAEAVRYAERRSRGHRDVHIEVMPRSVWLEELAAGEILRRDGLTAAMERRQS